MTGPSGSIYVHPRTNTHVLTNKTRRSDQRWWDISWGITAPLADSKSNLRHCVFILRHRHPFLVFLYSGTFLALPLFYLIKHPLKEAIAQGCHEKDAWSGIMENRRTGERWVFLVLWWRMPLSAEGREMCLGGWERHWVLRVYEGVRGWKNWDGAGGIVPGSARLAAKYLCFPACWLCCKNR